MDLSSFSTHSIVPHAVESNLAQSMQNGLQFRGYQLDGIHFLHSRKRALNGDYPGLGKTPQLALSAEAPVLVAVPNYLTDQWYDWLTRYMPSYSVALCQGSYFQRRSQIREFRDFTVINHEMFRTHSKILRERNYETVIIDESHHLRNHRAKKSKGAAFVCKRANRVYLASATPVWKEIDDLYFQLHLLQPEIFSSYQDFVHTYCLTESNYFGTKVIGARKDKLKELEDILQFVMIRRSYEDVGRQVPPLIEKTIRVSLPESMEKLYKQTTDYWIEEIEQGFNNWSQVMHALRQITGYKTKIEAIQETLEDTPKGTKTVIFCWYRDLARKIANHFKAPAITGDLDVHKRREIALGEHDIIVATIASLSEGIDLSFARNVVFAEEHWPPGSNYQALSRVHRERQFESNEDPVVVHYVHHKNTIDERIHAISQRREASIRDVIMETLGIE